MENSTITTDSSRGSSEHFRSADNMGRLRETGGAEQSHSCEQAGARHMGTLGESEGTEADSPGAKIVGNINPLSLRPADLVRMLNSTHIGKVLDDRQFYRHRMRAGFRFSDGRRVNLLRYIGWLIEKRDLTAGSAEYPGQLLGSISIANVTSLLKRQQHRCALTGRKLEPTCAALDHAVPISRGGQHRIENAQVLHKDVNRAKGTLTTAEFVQICREVVNWIDAACANKVNESPRSSL